MQLCRLYANMGEIDVCERDEKTAGAVTRDALNTSHPCVVAAFGFACTTAWGTYIMFSPALPILSFAGVSLGIACLLASKLLANVLLAFLARRPNFILARLPRLVMPGVIFFYGPAFALALLAWVSGVTPPPALQIAIWVLLGFGELSFSFAWPVLFASMPTRWSSLSIAVGGALATPMFLLIADARDPIVGLVSMFLLVLANAATITYLLKIAGDGLIAEVDRREPGPATNMRANVSTAASGVAYGFTIIMLCLMGTDAIIMAALAGLVASALAIVWAMQRVEKRWDTGMAQRMTMPVIVAALLLIPLVGEYGRMLVGAIATAAFAYSTLMEWTDTAVTNFEFQLHPVKRTALGRFSQWTGFLAGGVIAYATFSSTIPETALPYIVGAMAVALVTAFAFYGADDSSTKEALTALVVDDSEALTIEPPKNAAPFRDRCAELAERHGLSEREAEVFVLLAKGRNSEYIQKKLFISGNTVKTHVSHIYRKMGISSQQSLIDQVDKRYDEVLPSYTQMTE